MIKLNVIEGDRQTGRTTMAALMMRIRAETVPSFRGLWLTNGYFSTGMPMDIIAATKIYSRTSTTVQFHNKSSVVFRSYSSRSTLGLGPMDLIVMDNYMYPDDSYAMKLLNPVVKKDTLVWTIPDKKVSHE